VAMTPPRHKDRKERQTRGVPPPGDLFCRRTRACPISNSTLGDSCPWALLSSLATPPDPISSFGGLERLIPLGVTKSANGELLVRLKKRLAISGSGGLR
jgi:hypothetical protein